MKELQIDRIPLFNSLPGSEIKFLTGAMRPIELEAGVVLVREGERGDQFYIILGGRVEIIKALGTAGEQIMGSHGPGDFFGEMSLLIPDGLRTASVRASTPLKLIALSRVDFDKLIQRRPLLAYEMVRVLSLRLRKSDNDTIRDLEEKNRQLEAMYRELQAAQAQIVEKEKLEHELDLARAIQESILPADLVFFDDFDFGARMLPARSVGGDLYDFIRLDADKVGVAIGDVSGKGVPAALFMALFCSLLRSEARHSTSPAEVLRRVNQHLLDLNETRTFVTGLFGILDRRSREFTYARAGHEIPILFDRHGVAGSLDWGHGQLLGFFDDLELDEGTLTLPQGSTLLLYTDGAFDALDPGGLKFGLTRLVEAGAARVGASAQGLCDQVMGALLEYQGAGDQYDDITLVAIQSR